MDLPSPVRAFFAADTNRDGEAVKGAFASNAIVEDESHSHAGREAIGAWWHATKAKYQTVNEPLELRHEGDAVEVRVRVTGQFPGSPIKLTFVFRLDDDQISRLSIRN